MSYDFEDDAADEKAEEERARKGNEHLHKYSLIEITSPTEIVEHTQFLYDYQPGTFLYVSFPYLLVMDE